MRRAHEDEREEGELGEVPAGTDANGQSPAQPPRKKHKKKKNKPDQSAPASSAAPAFFDIYGKDVKIIDLIFPYFFSVF